MSVCAVAISSICGFLCIRGAVSTGEGQDVVVFGRDVAAGGGGLVRGDYIKLQGQQS